MKLFRYWRLVRRRALILILCPIATVIIGILVAVGSPNVYEAHVSLLVRSAQRLAVGPGAAALMSDQLLRTYARLITERPLLERVISDHGLNTDPVSLAKHITVTPEPNALSLDIAVQDTDPVRARDTANALVAELIAYIRENKTVVSSANLVVLAPAVLPQTSVSPRFPTLPVRAFRS